MTPWIALLIALVAVACAALALRRQGTPTADGDASVLEQLAKAGSNLSKPHDIEFFFYFPTEASAQNAAAKLGSLELGTVVKPAAEGSSLPWHVLAVRRMVPELAELHRLRASFTDLAKSEDGEFDGWGTPVVP